MRKYEINTPFTENRQLICKAVLGTEMLVSPGPSKACTLFTTFVKAMSLFERQLGPNWINRIMPLRPQR
jgi:hypothetical protein